MNNLKQVSNYTRPKFKKGIGWTLYHKPVELFYRVKIKEGGRATGEVSAPQGQAPEKFEGGGTGPALSGR